MALVLTLVALCEPGAAAGPQPPAAALRPWRVCVTDMVVPPFINNAPSRLGITERLLVEAGLEAGLDVELLRYPPRRCRLMMESGKLDAALGSSASKERPRNSQLPMRDGEIDRSRRVAHLNLVWIKRSDSPLQWDGKRLVGAGGGEVLVGSRAGFTVANSQLLPLGLRIDDTALNTPQLLLKIRARRVSIGVALREEVEFALAREAPDSLEVLPLPLSSNDYFAMGRSPLPADQQLQLEAWWAAIARLREAAPPGGPEGPGGDRRAQDAQAAQAAAGKGRSRTP
ncbi:MAG: hypothetical protein ABW005_05355 [Burkholderiaceae bacterium]